MHITIATSAAPEPRRGRLCCPVCQDQRVVPAGLVCTSLLGQRGEVQVDRDGLHLHPAAPGAEAGSAIVVTFRCGGGHLFCLRLRTIYDTTTAETASLPIAIIPRESERN